MRALRMPLESNPAYKRTTFKRETWVNITTGPTKRRAIFRAAFRALVSCLFGAADGFFIGVAAVY